MATKEELVKENAELKARVKELEENAERTLPDGFEALEVDEPVVLRQGDDGALRFEAVGGGVHKRVRDEDGQFEAPVEGALYRYDGSDDFVKVAATDDPDRLEMLVQDVSRLEIERNDARNEVQRLRQRLADAGALHGRIDNLPRVAG